ncbi:TVP38/TMEM64 family protein [Actinokineospora bangkokensis]|uniref:TVP38/TMEM64 family membrane protein n=1 Tax=Actinokineospora bangkokensis TaxID=1193682 RepID=A0A1Q9LFS7_9PSEU|nr:TVP38/TMEM64 family protein [Actinokineospora bangkokensis]OLR90870.1 hypothetical protein BJP25_30390 [Actinokineospora bangkokensis]
MSGRRVLVVVLLVLAALVAVGSLVPLPTPVEVRDWASSFGWATPALFLVLYAVLTVPPVPRTVFNLSVGLVLGNALGIAVAMVATTLAAWIAFALSRGLLRRWIEPHLERAVLRTVNARLSGSGFAGVLSLRLIPIVPFAAMNYCCGVSSMRLLPYLAGTFLGSVPGTVAAVLLGDALTGRTSPLLLGVYAVLAVLGAGLMWWTLKRTRPEVLEPVSAP